MIAALKLEILKLRRELYGQKSERKARLLDQLELQLEELEATATEDELAAEQAAARATTPVRAFDAPAPGRKPFPEHLPRERVVIEAPATCGCCGSGRIAKLGEDVTETLEVVPRQWKVIQTVREKFTCRDCERITQPPAPFHPTPRGWAGPSLLAMILFEKFGQHQPLNRQAERYAREGVELSLSTLADQVGACAVALAPLHALIAAHVLAAERLHGDDTPVPVLAKGKTDKGRLWVYVRDDRPFAGGAPPAALFQFSRNRRGEHPQRHLEGWAGVLQADAYAASGPLRGRSPAARGHRGAVLGAMAGASSSSSPTSPRTPGAARTPSRSPAGARGGEAHRCRSSISSARSTAPTAPPVSPSPRRGGTTGRRSRDLDAQRARAPLPPRRASPRRWTTCSSAGTASPASSRTAGSAYSNNAAERSLRGVALGRKSWLFCGSERGGDRTAFMYTLITTAKLNDVDPQAWLAGCPPPPPPPPPLPPPALFPGEWARQRAAGAIAA